MSPTVFPTYQKLSKRLKDLANAINKHKISFDDLSERLQDFAEAVREAKEQV